MLQERRVLLQCLGGSLLPRGGRPHRPIVDGVLDEIMLVGPDGVYLLITSAQEPNRPWGNTPIIPRNAAARVPRGPLRYSGATPCGPSKKQRGAALDSSAL